MDYRDNFQDIPLREFTTSHESVIVDKLDNSRRINVNGARYERFVDNEVRTARYTLVSWFPKSLFWQFRRIANIYFLIMSILTAMPFSPKSTFSMMSTFASVLIFTMFKEAYEDYFRHKQDKEVNNMKVFIVKGGIVEVKSKDLQVGDIIMIKENGTIPADVLFLSSSSPKGFAYVNTMNLDGETNLKEKLAMGSTRELNESHFPQIQMEISCELPNENMNRWDCNLQLKEGNLEALGTKQLLLRGCVLKNTDFVYGVVVYTGHDSKIMLNSKSAPSKVSNILRRMNTILYTVFAFQLLICATLAAFTMFWNSENSNKHSYLELDADITAWTYFIQILIYWVAYSHMIPISLYVALEVVKMAQAYLISQDIDMYYMKDDKPARSRTSDLVEELGQVEFVFSDKTGTLTCNEMKFRKFSINGEVYGHDEEGGNELPLEIIRNTRDPRYNELLRFFKLLAVCHSVFPAADKEDPTNFHYQAPSPDELALVEAAASVGIQFYERTENKIKLKLQDATVEKWRILAEFPFDSERKRMSIVVLDPTTEEVLLLTKGADSVMLDLLCESHNTESVNNHIYKFAIEGYRTLVMAQRHIPQSEFSKWFSKYKSLKLRNNSKKDSLISAHALLLERDLELVGISAIEDKLQDGVAETIELLMQANIRVWVLTGDKEETAIEIGKNCRLLTPQTKLIKLTSTTYEEIYSKINWFLVHYDLGSKTYAELESLKSTVKTPLAVVVDGETLSWVLSPGSELRESFFKLAFLSHSCICCRVSPKQKLGVVALAKSHGNWITLSIGDGANDVSMIQEAHIGVGIVGREGTQAVQSSDFSFAQFKYLTTLLLVHGRWSYRRISWFICYYFYKNIVLVFTELSFPFFNGFSGQIYFLDLLPMLYNALWTSWPCIVAYIFEQDLNAVNSLRYPCAYAAGQKGAYFTFRTFWVWILLAAWHGAVCYWVPVLAYGMHPVDASGQDTGLWWVSSLSFTLVIHLVTLKLFVEINSWTLLNFAVCLLSIGVYYVSVIMLNLDSLSALLQPEMTWLFMNLLGNLRVWIGILLVPIFALLPDVLMMTMRFVFWPNPVQQLMKELG